MNKMKTMKKEFICLLLILFSCAYVNAQENIDLTAEEYDAVSSCVRKEVGLFTQYLSFIVDPQSSSEEREEFKRDALKLFIERGNKYFTYVYNEYNIKIDSIEHRPVKMQTTSLRNPVPKDTAMVKYLTNLVNSANKSKFVTISIKSTDWRQMKVNNIRKLEGDTYEVVVTYEQWYRRTDSRNREIKRYSEYADKTTKRAVCRVNIVRTDSGLELVVQLGDVTAIETKKYE